MSVITTVRRVRKMVWLPYRGWTLVWVTVR